MINAQGFEDVVVNFVRSTCQDNSIDCDACMEFEMDVSDAHNEGRRPITSVPEQVFLFTWLHTMAGDDRLLLTAQFPIGEYFTDFYVSALSYFVNFDNYQWPMETLQKISAMAPRYAIEIDGFEWHDKTPVQAERDKRRERSIQLAGYTVLRFAAREVLADPFKCVREIRLARLHSDIQSIINRLSI